jgi:hypothetical protein
MAIYILIRLNLILLVFVNQRSHFKNDCKINCITNIEKSSNYASLYTKQFQPNKPSFKNNLHAIIHNIICRMCIVYDIPLVPA